MMHGCRWAAMILVILSLLTACGGSTKTPTAVSVVIHSNPEGASVMADAKEWGVTPTTITVAPGFVDVLLKKDNFKVTNERIEVSAAGPQEFTIGMQPLMGYVTFESDPDGATVKLAGEVIGKTPIFSREMPVGECSYEMSLENHYGTSDVFEVQEDFKYTKKHVLKPMEATLSLTSRPSGAKIFINNKQQGETTPAKFTLMPGQYVISVYAEGYVQQEEKLLLAPSEEKQLALTMIVGDVPPGMVLVPAGEFIFGTERQAPDEEPMTTLYLPAFYIDKTEVTNREYQAILPDHKFPTGQEDFPVTGISWSEATKFASLAGKRLPTEQEWEKAARGAEGRVYPWGNEYDPTLLNGLDQNREGVVRVSQHIGGMSPYGCMDMSGNVYEWTQSWYEAYPGNTVVTSEYGQIFRVLRGGGFKSDRFDVRAARRRFDKMDAKKPEYGFRCALDAK